jgi:OOP family OmpA-OmpF porin
MRLIACYTRCPAPVGGRAISGAGENINLVPGGSTPDYFHSCCPPEIVPPDTFPRVGLPDNVFGFQHAHTGESYTGIYVYNGPNQEELREYLQVELAQPIYAGVRYRVSFYVSLADKFQHAVGTLGAYFTNAPVINDDWGVYEVEPQIESDGDMVFNDKENWILIEDTFNSRYGGERYMLIGNFRIDSESNVTFVDSGATLGHVQSYYYIDDVSVIALDSIPNSIAEPAQSSPSPWRHGPTRPHRCCTSAAACHWHGCACWT